MKRRSREVSAELGDIADEVKSKAGAAKIWRSLGMPGGDKVDLSDSGCARRSTRSTLTGAQRPSTRRSWPSSCLPRPTHEEDGRAHPRST